MDNLNQEKKQWSLMRRANKNIRDLNIREELSGATANTGELLGLFLSPGENRALLL